MARSPAWEFWNLFRSRLSQRIVLSVFTSIVVIEAIILIPSIYRRENELLEQVTTVADAHLEGSLTLPGFDPLAQSEREIFERVRRVAALRDVLGGTLYTVDGKEVDSFGEPPELTFKQMEPEQESRLFRSKRRYDVRWEMSLLADRYVLIIRHDTTAIQKELQDFVKRIGWLVLIISGVVTSVMMVVLRSLLIAPILALRSDLLRAAPAALKASGREVPAFASNRLAQRDDELGEVIVAFQEMFGRISRAIVRRREAEQELRESESRFRTVVNQAAETILVLCKDGRIVDANRFALRSMGYNREELLEMNIFQINPVISRERFEAHWQSLQAGEPVTIETVHRRKDGYTYPVEVRSGLMRMGGEPQLLSLVRDITARKEAEKATARLAEIGELAAMIVHELRNPLATVFMALTGFKRMELPRAGQMRLDLALEESERLQRLLNEILAYSREQRLDANPVELNALSQELCENLSKLPQAEGREIRLSRWKQTLQVMGDRDKLKQVFINLVTNACEAVPAGEAVTWDIEASECSGGLTPGEVTVRVQNGGDPIPPEVLPKLTKPFVSTKPTGNGLGLAITKRIIEAHGGSLTIRSNAEEGTTVTVVLPISPELASEVTSGGLPEEPAAKESVSEQMPEPEDM